MRTGSPGTVGIILRQVAERRIHWHFQRISRHHGKDSEIRCSLYGDAGLHGVRDDGWRRDAGPTRWRIRPMGGTGRDAV